MGRRLIGWWRRSRQERRDFRQQVERAARERHDRMIARVRREMEQRCSAEDAEGKGDTSDGVSPS